MTTDRDALTAERVREILRYDSATGHFIWAVSTGARAKVGASAGHDVQGYLSIRIGGHSYYCHRLAWLYTHGKWPKNQIDHINGNRSDNRLVNLRDVSGAVNQENQRIARSNNRSSWFLGVSWYRQSGKWVANIKTCGKMRHLGYFKTAEEASAAYIDAKRLLHVGCTL